MNAPERSLNPPEGRELTEAELSEAREEICEDIIVQNKAVCGWDLAACIDCEINSSEDFAARLANVGNGLYSPHGSASYVIAMDLFYHQIVSKHLPDEVVEARAVRNDEARKEEARV